MSWYKLVEKICVAGTTRGFFICKTCCSSKLASSFCQIYYETLTGGAFPVDRRSPSCCELNKRLIGPKHLRLSFWWWDCHIFFINFCISCFQLSHVDMIFLEVLFLFFMHLCAVLLCFIQLCYSFLFNLQQIGSKFVFIRLLPSNIPA